ncbi:hypothetical protein GCT13_47205 [Paraburkholderia sp. CNPSo 3157]|uniref:Uncharacterized protein n=1 Tax=Paraburkholderia franconis TaxID=2654983 RepID=A0A7X1TLR1_9BURK|nr:hypothetical protein [Paraburkholderia franconis]MPW24042.1 hypothetical protein [Paraburkholderia franconis]
MKTKDAERYRHIRNADHNGYMLAGPQQIGLFHVVVKVAHGEADLDAAIDAAIAASAENVG